MNQAFLFDTGRATYPAGGRDLAGEIVAVEERGMVHEMLELLPARLRPALLLVRTPGRGRPWEWNRAGLVKRIIEVHGGRIWIESEGGGSGATFCFTLPPPDAGGSSGSTSAAG